MNEKDKVIIVAECNTLQTLINDIYIGSEEFTTENYNAIMLKIKSIRERVYK